MTGNAMQFKPVVLLDASRRPYLVFAKGRTKYHAVAATDNSITMVTLDTLRGMVPAMRRGDDYPPKRCASFWLNHDFRPITHKRAAAVLRGFVSRKPAKELI